jgi:hypothetical protein
MTTIEIVSADANYELVRDTSEGGTLRDSRVVAGAGNEHFLVRSNAPTDVFGTTFVDRSDDVAHDDYRGALQFNDPGAAVRDYVIDVSDSPREPWSGHEPEMENVEIIE